MGGTRGTQAAHALSNANYTNMHILEGGMRAWSESGYTLVKDSPRARHDSSAVPQDVS